MGKDLYNSNAVAKDLFEKANDILGFRITDLMFDGTEEDLRQTKVFILVFFFLSGFLAQFGFFFVFVWGFLFGFFTFFFFWRREGRAIGVK